MRSTDKCDPEFLFDVMRFDAMKTWESNYAKCNTTDGDFKKISPGALNACLAVQDPSFYRPEHNLPGIGFALLLKIFLKNLKWSTTSKNGKKRGSSSGFNHYIRRVFTDVQGLDAELLYSLGYVDHANYYMDARVGRRKEMIEKRQEEEEEKDSKKTDEKNNTPSNSIYSLDAVLNHVAEVELECQDGGPYFYKSKLENNCHDMKHFLELHGFDHIEIVPENCACNEMLIKARRSQIDG